MSKKSTIKRSVKLRPSIVLTRDKKDNYAQGSREEALNDTRKLIHYVQNITQNELSYQNALKNKQKLNFLKYEKNYDHAGNELNTHSLKPAEEARQAGISVKTKINPEIRSKSRVEKLILDQLVSKAEILGWVL